MKVKAALAALAIGGGATVAAVTSAGPALGSFSPPLSGEVNVNSPGTLVAGGAGVDLVVTAECAGGIANFSVELTQRAGSQIATGGSADVNLPCTNTSQTFDVRVVASRGRAFKVGTAIATSIMSLCTADFSTCTDQEAQPTISITK